jgi:hypothetical protein
VKIRLETSVTVLLLAQLTPVTGRVEFKRFLSLNHCLQRLRI